MKHQLTMKIVVVLVLSCLLTGIMGCGSKKPAESEKTQSQAPTDSMQKAYGGNRPGAASQSR